MEVKKMEVLLKANSNWRNLAVRQNITMCTIVHAATCCWETYCPSDNSCPTMCLTST